MLLIIIIIIIIAGKFWKVFPGGTRFSVLLKNQLLIPELSLQSLKCSYNFSYY